MAKLRRSERKALFQQIGQAISQQEWKHRKGQHSFEIKRFDKGFRDPEDPLNTDHRTRDEIPFGPRFKTPQWERTTK